MRANGLSSDLEAPLRSFVEAAGELLRADLAEGAEVPFELTTRVSRTGARTKLYCYEPLTDAFIGEREDELVRLPEHPVAVGALVGFDGLGRYIATRTGPGVARGGTPSRGPEGGGDRAPSHARARYALRLLLEDVFADQSEFEVRPERIAEALGRLERAGSTSDAVVVLVATLHGVTIASQELVLTEGLTIARPEALPWVPEEALIDTDWPTDGAPGADAGGGLDHLLVALACGEPSYETSSAPGCGHPRAGIAHGREVLRDLQRALRLFGDARVALGPLAWARAGDEGRWAALALGTSGRPQGMLVVAAEQEDELRAFCNLVSRRVPHGNELAWALRRFELGCERGSSFEGLSDHLLALRALLEPEGPSSGRLAGRVAALCATPAERARLTQRMTKALKLEHSVVAGTAPERASAEALARDVANHLGALLRDVLCGHLSPDLVTLADELLTAPPVDSEQAPDAKAPEGQMPVEA